MRRTSLRLLALLGGLFGLATCHAEARGDLIASNIVTGTFYRVSTSNAALTVLANPGIANLADIQRATDGTTYGFTNSAVPNPTLYRFLTLTDCRYGQKTASSPLPRSASLPKP